MLERDVRRASRTDLRRLFERQSLRRSMSWAALRGLCVSVEQTRPSLRDCSAGSFLAKFRSLRQLEPNPHLSMIPECSKPLSPSMMPLLTPIALGRLAHPMHTWGRFHLCLQRHLCQLLTKQLRFPAGHSKAGKLCKRLLVACPPQHGKSTLISQLFPAIGYTQNPALKLILLSYAAELATSHAQIARDRVTEFGNQLRPDGALALRTDSRAKNMWRTTSGGYMRAAGIMGAVTGLAADGVIVDDPFK